MIGDEMVFDVIFARKLLTKDTKMTIYSYKFDGGKVEGHLG